MSLLAASMTATGRSATCRVDRGPFTFSLSGFGTATVALQRSTDGGTTWHNVARDSAGTAASYTADTGDLNGYESSPWALYAFNCSAYTSGTIVGQIGQ